jgi:hypothetical protein
MADLKGFDGRLNKSLDGLKLSDKVQEFIVNAARDKVVEALRSDVVANYISDTIREAAAAVGMPLTLTNIQDKTQTRADVDKAVTDKINALAGTSFSSLRLINREAIQTEVGRVIGEKLGLGNLYPVAAFREAMSGQLVSAFDGGASPLFAADLVARVEQTVVSGWQELSTKAQAVGNPMSPAGPPRDAAHAALRAAARKRQAKFRKTHHQKWVPLGYGNIDAGNGREGLTGKASGNTKAVLTEKQKLHVGGY